MESSDSPDIPDRAETSDIPGLPLGGIDKVRRQAGEGTDPLDHSEWNRSRRVIRSKVRLDFALNIPAGDEIESEAVFSTIDSVSYFELWVFVSTNLD